MIERMAESQVMLFQLFVVITWEPSVVTLEQDLQHQLCGGHPGLSVRVVAELSSGKSLLCEGFMALRSKSASSYPCWTADEIFNP